MFYSTSIPLKHPNQIALVYVGKLTLEDRLMCRKHFTFAKGSVLVHAVAPAAEKLPAGQAVNHTQLDFLITT